MSTFHLSIEVPEGKTPWYVAEQLRRVVWLMGELHGDEWPAPLEAAAGYVVTDSSGNGVGRWSLEHLEPAAGDQAGPLERAARRSRDRAGVASPEGLGGASADPENNEHNAFVQDFLTRWREQFIGTPPTGGDRDVRDYRRIDEVIEMVQETYGARSTPDIEEPAPATTDLFYERAKWPLGTTVTDAEDSQRRGVLVKRVARLWVDRDRKPPMVRWHGKLDAVEVPWERLRPVHGNNDNDQEPSA